MPHAVLHSPTTDASELVGREINGIEGDSFQLAVARGLLERRLVSLTGLAEAMRIRAEWGSELSHVLMAQGHVRPVDYYRAVADAYGMPFADLQREPVDADLVDIQDRPDYAELNMIPWQFRDGRLLIATTSLDRRHLAWAEARYPPQSYAFVITSKFDILWQTQKLFRDWDSFFAREALYAWKPEHSAKYTLSRDQKRAIWLGLALLALCLIAFPRPTAVALMGAATTLYTVTFVFKFVLTWVGASRRADMPIATGEVEAIKDTELPVYTVLVPMYREARVLPLLVDALQRLDYPAAKLDVKLVLEEDDAETIEAAKALKLPGRFEIIRVPPGQPKTKPKACNYALQFCRGDLITIFDAEDQPEPDQLKKAVLAFRKGDPRLACVQGRLNYFNRGENMLTRMFTLEYSQWFDFLLPGLDWLKVPIPLGGTSNHFKLDVLREVGAWDPYNVTEDADLGVRLAQEGYKVGVINSTTFEEANGVVPSWIKQRSRWIKGYMQTWLVHMRHPIRLWQSIGPVGFLSFQFFIGAPPFTKLLNPILWLVTLVVWATHNSSFGWLFPEPIGSMAMFNLAIGNLFLVYFGVIAALKRRYFDLVPVGVLLPVYWLFQSMAAYKALWQLVRNPHYWEKTEHGTSAVTRQSLAARKADHP